MIESGWPPVFDLLRYRQHDRAAVLCPYWVHRASPRTDEEERFVASRTCKPESVGLDFASWVEHWPAISGGRTVPRVIDCRQA